MLISMNQAEKTDNELIGELAKLLGDQYLNDIWDKELWTLIADSVCQMSDGKPLDRKAIAKYGKVNTTAMMADPFAMD